MCSHLRSHAGHAGHAGVFFARCSREFLESLVVLGNNLGKVECFKIWFAVKLPDLKNCSAKFRRKRPRKWPKSSRRTDETFSVFLSGTDRIHKWCSV